MKSIVTVRGKPNKRFFREYKKQNYFSSTIKYCQVATTGSMEVGFDNIRAEKIHVSFDNIDYVLSVANRCNYLGIYCGRRIEMVSYQDTVQNFSIGGDSVNLRIRNSEISRLSFHGISNLHLEVYNGFLPDTISFSHCRSPQEIDLRVFKSREALCKLFFDQCNTEKFNFDYQNFHLIDRLEGNILTFPVMSEVYSALLVY
jgi:hypothetical protein